MRWRFCWYTAISRACVSKKISVSSISSRCTCWFSCRKSCCRRAVQWVVRRWQMSSVFVRWRGTSGGHRDNSWRLKAILLLLHWNGRWTSWCVRNINSMEAGMLLLFHFLLHPPKTPFSEALNGLWNRPCWRKLKSPSWWWNCYICTIGFNCHYFFISYWIIHLTTVCAV
jgi:hypothetical protein